MKSFRCEGLRKAFDGVQALADVDLQFPTSGITAIIGPNGAGKTTLVNVLTGFTRPDAGRCFLDDHEITHLVPHRIAKLGVARTFQDVRLIRAVSALENVLLARPNQRGEALLDALLRIGVKTEEAQNRNEAMHGLAVVGLESKAIELAGELSYGQQKLLTLACCVATECRVLLLDEPVAGIHPEMITNMLNLLRLLREQGKLVIFIEHDIEAVRRIADHLIVMDEGKVIAQGIAEEVLRLPEILEAYIG